MYMVQTTWVYVLVYQEDRPVCYTQGSIFNFLAYWIIDGLLRTK